MQFERRDRGCWRELCPFTYSSAESQTNIEPLNKGIGSPKMSLKEIQSMTRMRLVRCISFEGE